MVACCFWFPVWAVAKHAFKAIGMIKAIITKREKKPPATMAVEFFMPPADLSTLLLTTANTESLVLPSFSQLKLQGIVYLAKNE
jgi:hypothetical protein